MTVIVTDSGFTPDTARDRFLDLASDTDPDTLDANTPTAIRIQFQSFSDGRGFTLARLLRLRGFTGKLRARGHLLADQYAMARRAGFDEIEIPDDIAARQPEDQWKARANWRAFDHQNRLRGTD